MATYIALTIGLARFGVWAILGFPFVICLWREWVTVNGHACPHALGSCIPLVVAISTAVSCTKWFVDS